MRAGAAVALLLAGAVAGCGAGGDLGGRITFDGAPDTAAWSESAGELFAGAHPDVRLRVDRTGEAAGLERLCAGEVDVVHAARAPRPQELAACAAAGHELVDVRVATDGLAVIAHPGARWVRCLPVGAVARLAGPAPPARWRALGPGFPDRPVPVVGAAAARAYARLGDPGAGPRYPPGEAAILDEVRRTPGAVGFVGVGFAARHADGVRRVAIAERGRCVAPTPGNVRAGRYRALARPVVLAVRRDGLRRPELQAFLRFAAAEQGAISDAALLVALTVEQARRAEERAGRAARPFT